MANFVCREILSKGMECCLILGHEGPHWDGLTDRNTTLESELAAWKKAVVGLTPSGSEFVDDPKRCAEYIRKSTNYPKMIVEMRAELAAMRETGPCGKHPKACLAIRKLALSEIPGNLLNNGITEVREGYCTACARERLVEAAALRKAADYVESCRESGFSDVVQVYDVMGKHIRNSLITPDAALALDAYVQTCVARAVLEGRIDAMIWCTGACSLNEQDNEIIQRGIRKDQARLAAARAKAALPTEEGK